MELIKQVRQMIEARYGEISEDVAKRADEDEFEDYQNDYTEETTEEYQHEDGDYNEAGAEGAGFERAEELENL